MGRSDKTDFPIFFMNFDKGTYSGFYQIISLAGITIGEKKATSNQ